ncbi:uncharacterized protein LOC143927449 isoform X2 [Lithobates pipiens]
MATAAAPESRAKDRLRVPTSRAPWTELHCVVENIPKRKSCHQCSGVKPHLIIFTLGLICLFILCGLPLFLYMLYQDVHYSNLLQTLTERLDAQSQILKQMVANQIIAGYNPGGL